jgi:hypothetical protein
MLHKHAKTIIICCTLPWSLELEEGLYDQGSMQTGKDGATRSERGSRRVCYQSSRPCVPCASVCSVSRYTRSSSRA